MLNIQRAGTRIDHSTVRLHGLMQHNFMTGSMDMDTPEGSGSMTFDMELDMQMMLADDGLGT